jgi:hypothetical protein
MSSISGVTSFVSQVSNLTTASTVAAPGGPPKGPPPSGARPPGGGREAMNSALEELLGRSDETSALEQKIQDQVDQVLQNGGTMEDVKNTVDNLLKEAGVDPQRLQQRVRPGGGGATSLLLPGIDTRA